MAEKQWAPLSGLVLAGGDSRRMGRDKAVIEMSGEPLLDRTVRLLRAVVGDVRVAVRPEQAAEPVRSRHDLVLDLYPGIGPAAGLIAAHMALPDAAWLAVACDMPLLDAATLQVLCDARNPAAAATLWSDAATGRLEPLCAVYEPATLAALRQHILAGGDPGLQSWLRSQPLQTLAVPSKHVLVNANTPADLQLVNAREIQPDDRN